MLPPQTPCFGCFSVSNLYSFKGTVRQWIHYLQTRCDPSTQLEHREIAEGIRTIFCEQFPVVAAALGWRSE
jgi:thymidylate synthase (FAD)